MAVQIHFEEISGQIFAFETLDSQKATMQLCYASLKEANPGGVPFTFKEMLGNMDVHETASLKEAVKDAMNEWFEIPAVMEQQGDLQEEDDQKNA